MVQELGSSIEGSRDSMTQTSIPKFVKEVVVEVMKADKVAKFISNHGNYESEYGEFDFGGEHSKKHIGYMGEGEGNVIGGIG
jgi:hypothetical protein